MEPVIRKNKELTRLGNLFGSTQFCYAEKPNGVEPGFRALDLNEAFFASLAGILAAEQLSTAPQLSAEDRELFSKLRTDLAKDDEGSSSQSNLAHKQVLFAAFINTIIQGPHKSSETPPCLQWLCTELKEAVAQKNLSAWLYKFDYAEGQKERIKTNKEALREYIGTYLARLFSEQNQKQELLWLKNGDKDYHALLACAWKNGLQELTPFLYGGGAPDYQGILVKDVNAPIKRAKYIPGLGKNLIFGLAIADRDGIGKNAQNKGCADGAFYGFDYGKAYEGTEVCSRLQDDFSFEDYYARAPSIFRSASVLGLARHWMYRNYSIFYDTSLAERMFGFHLLSKMITGESPSTEISRSYPELDQELTRIAAQTPSSASLLKQLAAIREEYLEEQTLALIDAEIKTFSPELDSPFAKYFSKIKIELIAVALKQGMPHEELVNYLKFITEIYTKAHDSNQHILAVFKRRALLTKPEIDFLEHLEKYCSPTSVTSTDGAILLNLMRIDPASSKVSFQLQKEEDGRIFLTTSNKKLSPQIQSELGLHFTLNNDVLSCTLKAEELSLLMRQVDDKYQQKWERLISEHLSQLSPDTERSACL